ncbi:MAG: hypothetical protein ACLGJB_13715 [Blastocatellia bacterium]
MKDNERARRASEIDASDIDNPGVRHEVSDVRIKPIIYFGVGLVVAAAIIHLAVAGLFKAFEAREDRIEGKQSPLAAERQRIPPEPRLYLAPRVLGQPRPDVVTESPMQEYKKLRAEEDARLNDYNWVDQNAGVVTIPINEAKRLVIQRGLLVSRPAPAQSAEGPAAMPEGQGQGSREELPSDSSGGQKTEKRHP